MMEPWSVLKKTAWKAAARALSKAELLVESTMESTFAPKMARQIAQRRQPPAQKLHRAKLPTSKTEFSKR
jgi:hypothetical protein